MFKNGFWRWALLAAIVFGGLLLRLHNVAQTSMWHDETDMFNEYVFSDHHKSLVDFALYTRDRTTVTWGWPGIIWIVSRLFAPTIGTARMPTVLLSGLGVLVLFWLVHRLLPPDTPGNRFWPALFAALFAAVSIVQLEYSQRTYPYGVAPCLSAALLLAYFSVWKAASPGWKYTPRLLRAVAVFTAVAGVGFCIHGSLALLPAVCAAFLGLRAAPALLRQTGAERWKVLRLAAASGAILACVALANAKNPKYGFRPYLANYYLSPSLQSIPKLLSHAYDLATFQLNLFYNRALYWPERLNPVLLPLVLLCVFGWILAACGRFGRDVQHFSLLGLASLAMPAVLSALKVFPFGGVRQCLFLMPFVLAFVALGFYALRAHLITRVVGILLACGYLLGWAASLPSFYAKRLPVYTAQDIFSIWEQSGRLPIYARGAQQELKYALQLHPEIQIAGLPQERILARDGTPRPPYLVIGTHNWAEDNLWFRGYPEYLRQAGYKARLVKPFPAWNVDSLWYSQCLYFPPNGLWIYEITQR